MVRRERPGAGRIRRCGPVLVAIAAGTAFFASSGSSSAAVLTVTGGAFGEQVDITITDVGNIPSGPTPTVTLPASGGTAMQAAASSSAGPGGLFLTSGALGVMTEGTTGATGTVTSSATIATPNVLQTLEAAAVASTCTVSESASTSATTITNGTLLNADGSTTDLPAAPAPNTTFNGMNSDTGDSFRVVLNEQQTAGGVLTVNAVRFTLLGPTATGFVILGQSRCGVSSAVATTTTRGTGATTSTSSGSGSATTSTTSGTGSTAIMPRTGGGTPVLPAVALVVVALGVLGLTRRRPTS